MNERPPKERIKDFKEVSLGLTVEEAKKEAARCLKCKVPLCVKGCPARVDIPGFIEKIELGKRKEALNIIKRTNNLPAACGRVCPQEDQCEKSCILNNKGCPIDIGALERFASEAEAVVSFSRPDLIEGINAGSPKIYAYWDSKESGQAVYEVLTGAGKNNS